MRKDVGLREMKTLLPLHGASLDKQIKRGVALNLQWQGCTSPIANYRLDLLKAEG